MARLRRFVQFRWPGRSVTQTMPWVGAAPCKSFEEFTWLTFVDERQPRAVGIHRTQPSAESERIAVAELYGPMLLQSQWRVDSLGEWRQVDEAI